MKPDPRVRRDFTICDPACGTGGFLVAAYEWLMAETKGGALERDVAKRVKKGTYFGQDLVPRPRRLALMNLYLHGLEPTIKLGDSVACSGYPRTHGNARAAQARHRVSRGGEQAGIPGAAAAHTGGGEKFRDISQTVTRLGEGTESGIDLAEERMETLSSATKKAEPAMVEDNWLRFDVPDGWTLCTMGDVCEVVGGGTPKASDPDNFSPDGHPWITPADLSGFTDMYVARGARSLSDRGLQSCSARLLPPGTVLMSSRAPIGYLAIAANEVCTNQGFKSFICRQGVLPEYIYFWLKFAHPIVEGMGSGSTFTEVSGSRCREIPLLLAPLNEQKRIVAKVEELLARVNAARERLARIPAILKRFRQSVLAAACSGRLTADWREEHPGIVPAS